MSHKWKNDNGTEFICHFSPDEMTERMADFIDDVYYETEGYPQVLVGRERIFLDGGPRFRICLPKTKEIITLCEGYHCPIQGAVDNDAEYVEEVDEEPHGELVWVGID